MAAEETTKRSLSHEASGLSSLSERHHSLHAVMQSASGWSVPLRYSTVEDELSVLANGVGLGDLSHLPCAEVKGARAGEFVTQLLGLKDQPDFGRVVTGRYEGLTLECCRISTGTWLLMVWGEATEDLLCQIGRRAQNDTQATHVLPVTSGQTILRLAGPKSSSVLRKVTAFDFESPEFQVGSCASTKVAGVRGVLIRRLGGFDLLVNREFGEYVWEELLLAGRGEGIQPCGVEACMRVASG